MPSKEPITTLCENCGEEVPVEEAYECEKCGFGPMCASCVCEDCPEEDEE